MAYPFAQMPTLGQFVRRACSDYGCTHEKGSVTLFGPDGESRVSALSREENGERKVVVLPFLDDGERLTPHLLRSLCRRLGLPLADFGLVLSEDGLSPTDP